MEPLPDLMVGGTKHYLSIETSPGRHAIAAL